MANNNSIIEAKNEFKAADADLKNGAQHEWKAGQALERALAADPELTATALADVLVVSKGRVSKARTMARGFKSWKAVTDACKAAELTVTIDNVYGLLKEDRGPKTTSVVEIGERFGKSHADLSKDDFEKAIAAARKAWKANQK